VDEDTSIAQGMARHRANSRTERAGVWRLVNPIDLAGLQIDAADAIGFHDLCVDIAGIEVHVPTRWRKNLPMIQRMAAVIQGPLPQNPRTRTIRSCHMRNIIAT
jgi:hypothetical protein